MNKLDKTRQQLLDELQDVTSRMTEAEESLRAILSGEVDGLVVKTEQGDRVFTLSGADHPYRIMVETMNEGAVTLAANGTILFCNRRFTDIVRGSLEKVTGSSIYQYFSATDLPLFKTLLKEGLKGNCKTELVLRTGGNNYAPVLISINTLKHMDMPGMVCMVITDLTEQKRNEEMLKEEKLTSEIFNQAAEIFVLCDTHGRMIRASQSSNRLFSKSPIFRDFDDTFKLHYSDGTRFVLLSAISDNSHHTVEVTFRHGKNNIYSFLLSANSVIVGKGTVGIIVVMVDITERKKVEEKIEHLASFPQLNPNPVLETDATGAVTFCNPAALKILKELALEKEDSSLFLPKDFDAILRDWDKKTSVTLFRKAIVKNRVFGGTIQLVPEFKAARIYSHEITTREQAEEALNKVREELEERVLQRTAQLSDAYDELQKEVEDHKKTEEALRQAHKMEAIGTLAGGIAHDFNNLLAAIMGFTEMVIEDLPDGGEEERKLRHVLKSAHRGKDLIRQILAFSRKSDYVRDVMSLTPLIQETIQLLRASIPATIKIVFTTTATSDTVLASPTEIQQVLMNLATNASLAMRDKGGILEINLNDIDFQPDTPTFDPNIAPGEYIQLAVKDTGSGMAPEVMKRIFEPFFTTREVGKGTGMGLSVVYGIVTDLHGTVTVESKPGAGSIFRVCLPKIKSDVKSESKKADDNSGGSERVLFIDDEKLLVEWGQAALTRLGYKVTSMTDSAEALKIFSADPSQFDLVVTDQTMPGLTGIQLARKFLAFRQDIPIILFTGHSEVATREEAQAIGVKEFLAKPFGKQELAGAIRRVLDNRS
jgi:PAS domain S-box-containing protein